MSFARFGSVLSTEILAEAVIPDWLAFGNVL